jgi:Ni,Fe-hydrogenase maturation factor
VLVASSEDPLLAGKASVRVLIGGVGYRWMGDASIGLLASDALSSQEWPMGIEVADLGYGAIYAAQDLAAATPPYERLILITGIERGRTPGGIYPYRWTPTTTDAGELQARIREAGAGVIDIDHLLAIGHYLDGLPGEVLVIEVEPVDSTCGDRLSCCAQEVLPRIMGLVRQAALAKHEERQPLWSNLLP